MNVNRKMFSVMVITMYVCRWLLCLFLNDLSFVSVLQSSVNVAPNDSSSGSLFEISTRLTMIHRLEI